MIPVYNLLNTDAIILRLIRNHDFELPWQKENQVREFFGLRRYSTNLEARLMHICLIIGVNTELSFINRLLSYTISRLVSSPASRRR